MELSIRWYGVYGEITAEADRTTIETGLLNRRELKEIGDNLREVADQIDRWADEGVQG